MLTIKIGSIWKFMKSAEKIYEPLLPPANDENDETDFSRSDSA